MRNRCFPAAGTSTVGPEPQVYRYPRDCRSRHCFDRGLIGQISPKRKRVLPYPRESNETPRENAFCLVAPTVRLSDFAILPADVFFLARLFNICLSPRTSLCFPSHKDLLFRYKCRRILIW